MLEHNDSINQSALDMNNQLVHLSDYNNFSVKKEQDIPLEYRKDYQVNKIANSLQDYQLEKPKLFNKDKPKPIALLEKESEFIKFQSIPQRVENKYAKVPETYQRNSYNPNLKFKGNKEVKAIKNIIRKGMTNNQLESLGYYIVNPDVNLKRIQIIVLDGKWELLSQEGLIILLYRIDNVGLYISFRKQRKDWIYLAKFIK
jgi:hypothetical protein